MRQGPGYPSVTIRPLILALLLLFFPAIAVAQCQKQRPALQPLRYEEDWSSLANADCKKEAADAVKYIPLGRKSWYLSIGAEIRYRYENYDNPGFGADVGTAPGYILQRYLLHADWHLGPHFRLFTQFQSGLEEGRKGGPRLTDKDIADLHQAFFDISDSSQNLRLRVGRQEIEFGAGRLIGESEGLNIRRAFDGFRLTFKHGRWTWNSTLTHPVLLRPNTFAIPDHKQTEWGVGFTRAEEHGGWSGYYIGLNRKVASFNRKAGHEVRETLGSRIWSQGRVFDYNTDFIFQTGSFASGYILAGAVSSNAGITLHNLKFRPRLGVRFDYESGDSDRSGKNLNTFNPLFPNPMYSSLSALLGPSNLIDLGPTIRLALNSKTAFTPEMPFYWRSSIHDGIYGFAGNLIRPGNPSSARFVGFQPGVVVERSFSLHFSITGGYFHFFAGQFLHETPPGKNVGYFYATLTFRL
ncbi:MAG TPA: alginate export family protein [Candidatus Acidoferrales bacterium]|nr:alginate export family protein [Candidatus Acidoferrales bacterium]